MEESNITFESLGLSEAMLKALEKKGIWVSHHHSGRGDSPFSSVAGCNCQGTYRHR